MDHFTGSWNEDFFDGLRMMKEAKARIAIFVRIL